MASLFWIGIWKLVALLVFFQSENNAGQGQKVVNDPFIEKILEHEATPFVIKVKAAEWDLSPAKDSFYIVTNGRELYNQLLIKCIDYETFKEELRYRLEENVVIVNSMVFYKLKPTALKRDEEVDSIYASGGIDAIKHQYLRFDEHHKKWLLPKDKSDYIVIP